MLSDHSSKSNPLRIYTLIPKSFKFFDGWQIHIVNRLLGSTSSDFGTFNGCIISVILLANVLMEFNKPSEKNKTHGLNDACVLM